MDHHQQLADIVYHTKVRGICSVAACLLGLIVLLALYGWWIRMIRRSDWDSVDRGLSIGIGSVIALLGSALFVYGICVYVPDIFAPMGGVVHDYGTKFDLIKITVGQ